MLFDEKICHVTFTHSDCADVWSLYFPQMEKYFQSGMNHYVLLNSEDNRIPDVCQQIIYNDQRPYPERLYQCLKQLGDFEYIFFDHEDMFLYDHPIMSKLQEYYLLCKNREFDHIRLIKGGDATYEPVKNCPSLYRFSLKSKWIFSIQPSFWHRETLMAIIEKNLNANIWELETRSQKVVRKLGLRAAFSYRAGQRRGTHHFDNSVYPYIATAIGKGKWNLSEYGVELEPLLRQHNIDYQSRGWF